MTDMCPACGHVGGPADGPVHAYMTSSPGCWARYGEVLARDYSDAAYRAHHRALTDAWSVQHSISDDRRARQSFYLHLAALVLKVERDAPDAAIVAFLRRAAASGHPFPHVQAPPPCAEARPDAVYDAPGAAAHAAAVDAYARAVLAQWAPHHGAVRALIEEVGP
ncbi:hypothetical protein DXV76_04340 [Rhodobacteraceae bacterium CCMM004]|nr:hypothetical protein DXV76_04340 [Rhodobacteraceae bacterium CCMM004]